MTFLNFHKTYSKNAFTLLNLTYTISSIRFKIWCISLYLSIYISLIYLYGPPFSHGTTRQINKDFRNKCKYFKCINRIFTCNFFFHHMTMYFSIGPVIKIIARRTLLRQMFIIHICRSSDFGKTEFQSCSIKKEVSILWFANYSPNFANLTNFSKRWVPTSKRIIKETTIVAVIKRIMSGTNTRYRHP